MTSLRATLCGAIGSRSATLWRNKLPGAIIRWPEKWYTGHERLAPTGDDSSNLQIYRLCLGLFNYLPPEPSPNKTSTFGNWQQINRCKALLQYFDTSEITQREDWFLR